MELLLGNSGAAKHKLAIQLLIKIAVRSMGLDELAPFDPREKIIEYAIQAGGARRHDQLPLPPMAELRSLPTGTVGREYARFLDDHGLTPEALTPVEQEGPLGNLRAHMRGAHDLWHVVTGWTPDLLGELGLQAFYLAQLRVPFPGLILVAGLAHTVWKAPEHTFEVIDAVAEGWRQGQDAEMLAGLPWADYVEVPVSDLQAQLPSPDWSVIGHGDVWLLAFTIMAVASIETLLCVEATDKLDPFKRVSPTNRVGRLHRLRAK